uniref:DUF2064 domain-containing protein n=1 Tax=Lotharella globosa TaxID=91324 RepID=A0A6U2WUW6_9EUKA|mmetsp:Transcript_1071/g.2079  ORF Transcript_1071/g.2079 Transcript_1071/m.2079 type:complete len:288 (+) Transcript_1071:37-900(+)
MGAELQNQCKCARGDTDLGTLVMVAKYPTPKRSKTRLGKKIGFDKSAAFARASLLDLLHRFTPLDTRKVLLYAPLEAESLFSNLLEQEGLQHVWNLEPMTGGDNDTSSSDLGDRLKCALETVRRTARKQGSVESVAFIGYDCLDLSLRDVRNLLLRVTEGPEYQAAIIPANDGGYVALALSGDVPSTVFEGVKWSAESTCISQLQALSRDRVTRIHIGQSMSDIDEIDDLRKFKDRLRSETKSISCQRTAAFLFSFDLPESLDSKESDSKIKDTTIRNSSPSRPPSE